MPNIGEFFHSTISSASGETTVSLEGLPENIKCLYMAAPDARKELTWGYIDGIRRILEIKYYSDFVNQRYELNSYVRRVFSYAALSPRDLYEIVDSMPSL
jgi:hypothetical protein